MRVLLAVSLVSLLTLTPAMASAQVNLPSMGDGQEMTLGAERRLGERIAREIYRDPDYIDDPVLMAYLQSLWQPLLAAAKARGELTPDMAERFAFELMMGRDRSVNAFALPGGYFGIHLGLMALVSNRNELASVLAHELSHVTQRHIARLMTQQSQQAPWVLGAMILGALAASKSPDAAGALITGGQALAAQNQLNFSRDMEREADRVGYVVMNEAGFDTLGFVTMFDKLGQANRLSDSGAFPYLRTHPLTTERLADMQARLGVTRQQASAAPKVVDWSHTLIAARARGLSQATPDTQRSWVLEADAAAASATNTGRSAADPVRRVAALYTGILAAGRARDAERVNLYFSTLQPLVAADPQAQRLVRLLAWEWALQRGDLETARGFAQSLWSPGQLSEAARPEWMLWGQTSLRTGNAAAASERLQLWLSRYPKDAAAWLLLSQAWTAQGQTVRAVRAEAEGFAARFDYASAADRYRSAQDLLRGQPQVDHIEASIIDTRTRQIESLRREQALER